MGRRSDHSREELKELAKQAGLEIIRDEGFNHFRTQKVAGKNWLYGRHTLSYVWHL